MKKKIIKRLGRRLAIVMATLSLGMLLIPGLVSGQDDEAEIETAAPAVSGTAVAVEKEVPDEVAEEVAEVDEAGLWKRIFNGTADGLDWFLLTCGVLLLVALVWIIISYVKGLSGSPRELYLMFFTKVTEFSAYGAANMAFVLYLNKDVGLSDMQAGSFIGAWSVSMTLLMMLVGAVCDAIGVKKTLLIGCYFLLVSRFFMPLTDNLWVATFLGFVPLAFGMAITGPVLSVGIKMFTSREGAAMGFAMFYTLMNVGWAVGAWIFDFVRGIFGEGQVHALPLVGWDISSYQIIILVGFFLTIPDLIAICFMRDGVEVDDDGTVHIPEKKQKSGERFSFATVWGVTRKAAIDTWEKLSTVVKENAFWVFILLVAILVFVRLVFYHFHYTFPTYGIRVFGEGAKVGSIWGVLNPVLIVFLVPFIGLVTKRVSSYWMLLVGTIVSGGAVFLALLPGAWFEPLMDTVIGELIFDRWLNVPVEDRMPFYLSLILFFVIFTIGEAIWSPRLTQFMAEVAPKGREGSYIALSYLPYFGAKFIAGPMSGWLLATYVPEGADSYPNHYMVWVWIGLMASLTPAGLMLCYRIYKRSYEEA
ncbi:MAG: MFS transporter [Akkermansiaceae bacterium]|nr:MFS transporter [Akkermansiaceae bacterium]